MSSRASIYPGTGDCYQRISLPLMNNLELESSRSEKAWDSSFICDYDRGFWNENSLTYARKGTSCPILTTRFYRKKQNLYSTDLFYLANREIFGRSHQYSSLSDNCISLVRVTPCKSIRSIRSIPRTNNFFFSAEELLLLLFFFYVINYNIYRTNTYTTYSANIILTSLYIYIALLILTVFKQANRTNTYTTYNTSNIIFFLIYLFFFFRTNRLLYLHNCTYIIYLSYLKNNFYTTYNAVITLQQLRW